MLLRLSFVALTVAALTACSGGNSSAPASGPTAKASASGLTAKPEALVGTTLVTVNGAPVGTVAADPLAARMTPADGAAFSTDEKRDLVNRAAQDELLFQAAFQRGMYHDPKIRKMMVNQLLRTEIYGSVRNSDFSDDELRAYYDNNTAEFIVPEKLQIRRLLISAGPDRSDADAKSLADQLRRTLAADPTSFAKLAEENSSGPYARRGGDLGYVSPEGKSGIPDEIVKAAFELEVGGVSEVFRTGDGYNIVHVPNKRERLDRTFEQMKGSVLRRVKNAKYETLTAAFVDGLKEGAKMDFDETALSAWTPKTSALAAGAAPELKAPPAPNSTDANGREYDEKGMPIPKEGEVVTNSGSIIPADPEERDANDEKRALMEGVDGEE
ncbi:MAG: peptidylprolyl isomerase [Myxococcota bacterium]